MNLFLKSMTWTTLKTHRGRDFELADDETAQNDGGKVGWTEEVTKRLSVASMSMLRSL